MMLKHLIGGAISDYDAKHLIDGAISDYGCHLAKAWLGMGSTIAAE